MRSSTLLMLGSSSVVLAGVVVPAKPLITPAPTIEDCYLRRRQDASSLDLVSLGEVLLTGVPKSILAMALTNVPAVSRLLWSEFLDDNTPTWFTALPTDIQAYLSGEFGPTTAASNSASSTGSSSGSTSSPSATNTPEPAVADTQNRHNGGLPLWAKILIGVLVPLFVLGLLGLLIFCCVRRRRRRREMSHARSRTPTPAFISGTHRAGIANPPGEQHVPLRGGYISRDSEANDEFVGSVPHTSSNSEEYRTPIGGPSYENILPATTTNTQSLRRSSRHSSRHSSTSLHSVPEMPEPMQGIHHSSAAIPLPPRSSRRSREFGQAAEFGNDNPTTNNPLVSPLQPSYGHDNDPYHNQGVYTGGHSPYPNSHFTPKPTQRPYSDPFSDTATSKHAGHTRNSLPPRAGSRDPELFLNDTDATQDNELNWPLRAAEEREHGHHGGTKSYDRYYEKTPVYEM